MTKCFSEIRESVTMRSFNNISSQATTRGSLIPHAQHQANHQLSQPSSINIPQVDQGLSKRSSLAFLDQQQTAGLSQRQTQPAMYNSLGMQQQEFKQIPTRSSHGSSSLCLDQHQRKKKISLRQHRTTTTQLKPNSMAQNPQQLPQLVQQQKLTAQSHQQPQMQKTLMGQPQLQLIQQRPEQQFLIPPSKHHQQLLHQTQPLVQQFDVQLQQQHQQLLIHQRQAPTQHRQLQPQQQQLLLGQQFIQQQAQQQQFHAQQQFQQELSQQTNHHQSQIQVLVQQPQLQPQQQQLLLIQQHAQQYQIQAPTQQPQLQPQQQQLLIRQQPQPLVQQQPQEQKTIPQPPQQQSPIIIYVDEQQSPRTHESTGEKSFSLTKLQLDAVASCANALRGSSIQGIETKNQLLGKRKIQDLVAQVDPQPSWMIMLRMFF